MRMKNNERRLIKAIAAICLAAVVLQGCAGAGCGIHKEGGIWITKEDSAECTIVAVEKSEPAPVATMAESMIWTGLYVGAMWALELLIRR